jgi:hypothetical protein
MALKVTETIVRLLEVELLQGCAHGAIENDDALIEEGEEWVRGGDVGWIMHGDSVVELDSRGDGGWMLVLLGDEGKNLEEWCLALS